MLRVVVDANVWVSALLSPGMPEKVVASFRQGHFELYYPAVLVEQLRRVSGKPRMAGRITHEDACNLIALIASQGTLVELKEIPAVCRDPSDDAYLACAAAAKCDFIVSGDKDLLCLHEHEGTRVVQPAEFLRILREGSPVELLTSVRLHCPAVPSGDLIRSTAFKSAV